MQLFAGCGNLSVALYPVFSYIQDDSYTTFRYKSALAAGNGLVFNPNEYPRSEGLTSPFCGGLLALAIFAVTNVVLFAKDS